MPGLEDIKRRVEKVERGAGGGRMCGWKCGSVVRKKCDVMEAKKKKERVMHQNPSLQRMDPNLIPLDGVWLGCSASHCVSFRGSCPILIPSYLPFSTHHCLHSKMSSAAVSTLIREFFSSAEQKFAVVGASTNRSKFGNKVLRWYMHSRVVFCGTGSSSWIVVTQSSS